LFDWLHLPQKHVDPWPNESSPTDDCPLPFATSVTQNASQIFSWQMIFIHPPILLVIVSLPISTALVLWCLSTLPISVSWPRNIADLAQLGRELHGYSQSGSGPLAHVIGVMAISAIWKHAWSIPGSVLWNVLAGALFSPVYATILLTTLTTLGSLCATLLSKPFAPFLAILFPRALDMTRNALSGGSDQFKPRSSPWVRLSVMRLIGVVPWSGINIASGVCGVSLKDCMFGTFIGCLPWTAVTCQIGDILQTVASTPTPTPQTLSSLLASPDIIFKLIFLSVLSLAPILGRTHLRAMIPVSTRSPNLEEQEIKWTLVNDLRPKTAISAQRQQDQHSINIFSQEKSRD